MLIEDQKNLPRYCSKSLRDNEVFVAFTRKTLFGYMFTWALSVALILAAFFLMFLLFRQGDWGVAVFAAMIALGALIALRQYVLWFFTGVLITDRRVVDFDQAGLLRRTVTESSYDMVEDVNISQKGAFAMMFRYGTIYIHTKGSKPDIEITKISKPESLLDVIANYQS